MDEEGDLRQDTFCFQVMPFDLKNVGTMFQRLMDKVFEKQIRRNVEVYVDNILVRSRKVEDNLKDLQETFENLSKVALKLKVEKCVFVVTRGKFLGYMINKERIKLHSKKV